MNMLESHIPIGTDTPHGKIVGVQMMDGERYYFLDGAGISYMPADVIEQLEGA